MSDKEEYIADFRMSGEWVASLKDKKFTVLDAENEDVDNLDKAGEKKKKTVLTIEVGGQKQKWYANKTSTNYIAKQQGGFQLKHMIGFQGELITINQKVGKEMRLVVYVKGSVKE